jgi:hypothetical protein
MSSSRRGGTKLQNRAITVVALSSNENHSSNGRSEVIHAHCYFDLAYLVAAERNNKHADGIDPLLL